MARECVDMKLWQALSGAAVVFAVGGHCARADPLPVDLSSAPAIPVAPELVPPRHCPGPPPTPGDAKSKGPARYYPERAMRANLSGKVVMDCLVLTGGTLADCKLVSETPEGYGFGESALKMSVLFKMKGGECSRVQVPVSFKPPR